MSFTPIPNLPVAFNVPNNTCNNSFDEREYCQMVEQGDSIFFGWKTFVTEENVIECSDFDTESCAVNSWDVNGGWSYSPDTDIFTGFCGGNPTVKLPTSALIKQVGAITSTGVWKVTVDIPSTLINIYDLTGTFTISLGNATSAVTNVEVGTFVFYLNVTSVGTGTLTLTPNQAIMCVDSITCEKLCTSYEIQIKDKDNNYVNIITTGFTRYDETYIYQGTWSGLGLSSGCYKLCIVSKCESSNGELVLNGGFGSGSNWVTSGNFSIAAGVASTISGAGSGSITQALNIKSYTRYIVSYQILNGTSLLSGAMSLGGTSVALIGETGSYETTVMTGSLLTTNLIISAVSGIGNEGFDIDNISVKEADSQCTECYDLQNDHSCTTLLSWTNDDDAFGIPYSQTSITNYLRLFALLEKPRYPGELDRHIFSDGNRKILYASSEKIWTLSFDYLPEYLHDTIRLFAKHDSFYIDGIRYFCSQENYEPEWRGRLKLAQSKIEVQKAIDYNKNKNC